MKNIIVSHNTSLLQYYLAVPFYFPIFRTLAYYIIIYYAIYYYISYYYNIMHTILYITISVVIDKAAE